jgi:hypothetical protein
MPEIWIPTVASQDRSTSRTLAHASGTFSTKPRRESSGSVSTAVSIRATPEHNRSSEPNLSPTVEREHTRMQESEHTRSGISRTRQQTRKSSGADERVLVNQFALDSRRMEEHAVVSSSAASIISPVSSYDAPGYQTPGMTPGRPPMNPRRSFTDESRQHLPNADLRIWLPQAQVTEPKPIKSKRSFRDEDPGVSFQPSPSPSRWGAREPLIEEDSRNYLSVSSSPQELTRSRKPSSIRSRASVNSLRFRTAVMVNRPTETHAEDSEFDTESDDDLEGWQQELSEREHLT